MKMILTLAAAIAALTAASASFAHTPAGGHWEWQSRMAPGPNKSGLPLQVRVWVKDGAELAACNCAMMKMSAADCMMDMPGKPKAQSVG
jgi:hypothetical protein